MYPYDGHPEWLAKQKRFGAVNWMKKEFKRLEQDNPKNMKYVQNGVVIEYNDYKLGSSKEM